MSTPLKFTLSSISLTCILFSLQACAVDPSYSGHTTHTSYPPPPVQHVPIPVTPVPPVPHVTAQPAVQAVQPIGAHAVPSANTGVRYSAGNKVNLSIINRNSGTALPIYVYQGEYWVAGTPGQGYAIRLNSLDGQRRVLATTSIDGINILTGETAGFPQRGYVLAPHQSYEITGWRKSEQEVAAFKFANIPNTYAAQTGRPTNIGVMGVAVFPERRPPPPPVLPSPPVSRVQEPNSTGIVSKIKEAVPAATPNKAAATPVVPIPAPGSTADAAARSVAPPTARAVSQGIGTQHGERETSHATSVTFERESNTPSEIISVRYDTTPNLVARGVLRWAAMPAPQQRPQAFPAQGFTPDPPRQ